MSRFQAVLARTGSSVGGRAKDFSPLRATLSYPRASLPPEGATHASPLRRPIRLKYPGRQVPGPDSTPGPQAIQDARRRVAGLPPIRARDGTPGVRPSARAEPSTGGRASSHPRRPLPPFPLRRAGFLSSDAPVSKRSGFDGKETKGHERVRRLREEAGETPAFPGTNPPPADQPATMGWNSKRT